MRLQSLELFGFKSFAQRTLIEFDLPFTAIVGPNGCGKSNVVDAVKWVLGEQRARSLRGREMTDVIFNGSERRPSMDVAEVTLTFDNGDRQLPIDETEVQVARRLYRSGESEYLINGSVVRLRDIRELFMGTGLGPGGYSFMEQGKIDSVLASNPVDRRKVFEEAAGISRFRSRRHETELKLDKVDANLMRLADIIEELSRQQRSLKIQAGKAERYQTFSLRARELQAQVALYRYDRNANRMAELETQLTELRTRRDDETANRDGMREQTEAIEAELVERTESLTTLREKAAEVAARETAAHEMMALHSRSLINLETRAGELRNEIRQLGAEVERTRVEREQVLVESGSLTTGLDAMAEAVQLAEAAYDGLRSQSGVVDDAIMETDTSLQSLHRRQVELTREAARLDSDERRWIDEAQRAAERATELGSELESLKNHDQRILGDVEERREALEKGREARDEAQARLDGAEKDLIARSESHRECVGERSKVSGRVDALENHIRRNEGLDVGVRAILKERDNRSDFLPGFRGLLIDLFAVDLDRADSVEAALGDVAQAIVVETVEEALTGARFLGREGRGRAAFLPLAAFPPTDVSLPEGLRTGDSDVARVIASLLAGVRTMEGSEVARALAEGTPIPGLVVTTEGGIVRDGRVFISGRKQGEQGLVAVRSERDELLKRRGQLDAAATELETRLEAIRAELGTARETVRSASTHVAEAETALRAKEQELEAMRRQRESLAGERERLSARQAASEQELATLRGGRGKVQADVDELTKLVADAESVRTARGEERRGLRGRLEAAAGDLESSRLELATTRQKLELLESSAGHLLERNENAQRSIKRYTEELSGFAGDREKSAGAAEEEEKKAVQLKEELVRRREEISEVEKVVGEIRGRHEEIAQQLRVVDGALTKCSEELHKAEMRSNEVRVNQENLVEHIGTDLDLDLASLHEEYTPADTDWDAIEAELDECKARIQKLGNVNLAAIDDLTEVEERLEFLTVQRNDLVGSKQQLSKVLRDIESESTRLFVETFDRVRDHFQVMFRKLFGGGKAEIILVDPENVLESGIEITARPPGKEARSITLLSGGERTLTAVALLFSIIRAHPCPCCLMDEVDAALDEDNTERFCLLLDEFRERTQFLLITHSRRTMARADVLFGVTMGERGVSRHVGVRFEDVGDDGDFVERGADGKPKSGRGGKSSSSGGDKGRTNGSKNGSDSSSTVVAGEVVAEMGAAAEADAAN